nr:immunoglobulin heavy chain junction region [Macaca mulatta]MOV36396.1 immunoglobulin heavy chain junction region [Macaca mulatta]MOV36470.1 immunoglobulin heavy chain junction region [Macaca mulatta]MOV36471.1 immunoglobulin heavy chain junction region [Macaca mulatta]MOV36498.1 immunoglobulin heavy chain junction region [Macaca mulatta]
CARDIRGEGLDYW